MGPLYKSERTNARHNAQNLNGNALLERRSKARYRIRKRRSHGFAAKKLFLRRDDVMT